MDSIYNFQKLTPINDANLNIYENALDFVFNNPDIKNVGVSGAYSAGKSSIIETYKKLKPDVKFMHISLAYFQSTSDSDDQLDDLNENLLEGKILNQLIHQIEPTKIPQTNFRMKRQTSSKKLWRLSAMISLLALLIMYLLNFENWSNLVSSLAPKFLKQFLSFTTYPLITFLAGIICYAILSYLIYGIVKVQFNKNLFKGISVQGNTIEIFEESEESYFDKYLNEVLYLFENSGKDVIVFEDMDRYNTNQIFQRLREINTLINSRKKEADKPLRFFYLIKDDIFINKERTKFFDFIVPIIPILDGSNSFDQFIEHFRKGNIYNLFSEYFLQEISLYIDDMRILKNIYNEFLIYYHRITTTNQDPNKLLAIIIYKNIFPRDFSDLQLNRGFVYTLFYKKDEFINDEIALLENEIKQFKKAIESAQEEHLQKDEEVDIIYNPKIQNAQRYYNDQTQLLTKERESRKENIKNKTIECQNELKAKISLNESLLAKLRHEKLYEIINKQNDEKIFKVVHINEIGEESNFNDIKSSNYFPLIKFLIRNGYIDETYSDYMTYFYENSLSRVDKIFLRSVTDEDAMDYSYQLKDPGKVISFLNIISFEKEETLNFDLLSYLLVNKNGNNKTKILKMLQQLKTNKNFKFINLYFESGKPIAPFIKELNNVWSSVFYDIINESNFTEERKKQYALESLYHTTDLKEFNSDETLSNFISIHKEFLNILNPNISRLIDVFKLLNIKFESIDYELSDKKLFQAVYQNNCYAINYELVCLMLKKIYNYIDESDLRHKNYTIVLSKIDEPLVKYVQENIDDYVKEILENCNDTIYDSEETVVQLLNDENLELDLKYDYLDKLETTICSLQDIKDDTFWSKLIESNLVTYSEDNVLHYFCHMDYGLNETLTNFINQSGNSFNYNYDNIDSKFGKDNASKFFNEVVKSEGLELIPYKNILKSLNRCYTLFDITGISDSKIEILIAQGVICMTSEALLFMREHYPQKVLNFIEHNIQKYIEEVISKENFNSNEMYEILKSEVDDHYKLSLLQYTDNSISSISDYYSDEVKIYIIKNNLDTTDIPELFNKYPSFSEQLQISIWEIAINNIDKIIENKYFIPIQLCKNLCDTPLISPEGRLKIFAIAMNDYRKDECIECLTILNQKDLLNALAGKRPAIMISDTNKKILDIFVSKHWISSYAIDKNNNTMYRVSNKKIIKQNSLPLEML